MRRIVPFSSKSPGKLHRMPQRWTWIAVCLLPTCRRGDTLSDVLVKRDKFKLRNCKSPIERLQKLLPHEFSQCDLQYRRSNLHGSGGDVVQKWHEALFTRPDVSWLWNWQRWFRFVHHSYYGRVYTKCNLTKTAREWQILHYRNLNTYCSRINDTLHL